MSKRFILRVYGGNDYTETDAAFVELDDETLGKIRSRMGLAKMMKSDDSEFIRLSFFDYTPDFFVAETLGGDMQDRVEEQQRFETEVTEVAAVRVDVTQIHVTEDRVYWTTYLKHTDIRLETEALREEDL